MIPTKDVVIVEHSQGKDDWGRDIDPISVEYNCRIDYSTQIVQDSNGEDKVSKVSILVKGFAPITIEDTLKWSDGYGDHEAQPISVRPIKDLGSKVLFTKVVV